MTKENSRIQAGDAQSSELAAKYIVGIDLGTTNSAVAFIDIARKKNRVEDFAVPQISAAGEVASLELLPSFLYEAAPGEFTPEALLLPWEQHVSTRAVGTFARDHGAQVPGRLVVSAKSWLSHSAVDRTAPLLPWHAASDVEKISPVDATARYLAHIRNSWNWSHPEDPLEMQDLTITVPASFDEVARELTIDAAARAGCPRIILLEEPQAAFYAWIDKHARDWQTRVGPGQKILISDIGGGTSDFTLIEVRAEDAQVQFHRIAVGDHLILGGDNLDLALAYYVERKHTGGAKLTPRQFGALVRNCQYAKEILLGANAPERLVINIPGTGAALIGGSIQVEVSLEEASRILIDGFFPFVALTEKPSTRQSGFQEFGLPYAPDAAVTKYLAAFLTAHRGAARSSEHNHDPARPDIILFNGGVFSSTAIRSRLLDVLRSWFSGEEQSWDPVVFENDHPELAVARGAAYFGLVRRGGGVRINAGLARSYYMGIQTTEHGDSSALCIAPAGLQEGQSVNLEDRTFDLLIRQPVEFQLYVSSTRTTDPAGALIPFDPMEMHSLPPIRTVLRSGRKMEAGVVKVQLNARLSEIGTLDLWCSEQAGARSWKLQFDVRSATRTDIAAHRGSAEQGGFIDTGMVELCREIIIDTFTTVKGKPTGDPRELVKRLEDACGIEKSKWPPSLLRSCWEFLMEVERGRAADPLHEARWLNFLGFSLRPGYGYAVDDWRVRQTWQLFQQGVIHTRNQACTAEWWILWRRISGGLTGGQQKALAQPLLAVIRQMLPSGQSRKAKTDTRLGMHELAEIWRLLASLELLNSKVKIELGETALSKIIARKDSLSEAAVWSVGRLGARIPLYGPLNELIDPEIAGTWAVALMETGSRGASQFLALMQLCRRTDDRYRDVSDEVRARVLDFLREHHGPHHYVELLETAGKLDEEEQCMVFGEQLPKGLRLT